MIIKAIRMFDGGFMNQQFAFGGEEGKDKFDEQIIYRSSLQNFLIDTGSEVILVDTGFKTGYVAPAKKLGAPLYMGDKVGGRLFGCFCCNWIQTRASDENSRYP